MVLTPKDVKSSEVDTSAINANGIKRNWIKAEMEWEWAWVKTKADRKRFYSRFWDGHSFINLFVENFRLSPWLWGHIIPIVWVLREIIGASIIYRPWELF